MITLRQAKNNNDIPFTSLTFSGGEVQVRITGQQEKFGGAVVVTAYLYNAHDIIELLLVADALKQMNPTVTLILECPYLPYARQDRVCYPGEAFALKTFTDLIVSRFARVHIWDVHSSAALKLLRDNTENVHALSFVRKITDLPEDIIFVAPDKGAMDRVQMCTQELRKSSIVLDKVRDPNDGKIDKIEIIGNFDLTGRDTLIIDDICDGGRTFIAAAKVLKERGAKSVSLYVTHGIFSQGLQPLREGGIDHIYCPHIWPSVARVNSFITHI